MNNKNRTFFFKFQGGLFRIQMGSNSVNIELEGNIVNMMEENQK
jgi:hypothetical protein